MAVFLIKGYNINAKFFRYILTEVKPKIIEIAPVKRILELKAY